RFKCDWSSDVCSSDLFTPIIYNSGIIAGAFFLHRQLGIYSLAWGVLAGVILGSAFLNSLGAFRTGLHYRPIVNFRDPAFREWFRSEERRVGKACIGQC